MDTPFKNYMTDHNQLPKEQLSQLFGSYKAEWLKEKQLFDLFTEPTYFPELETARPCMLVGGRGTGKTTVLRCLSYEGQHILHTDRKSIDEFPYYGFYYRVNTNRVTAFRGPELEEKEWVSLFAHYFNLVLCEISVSFLTWYQSHCSRKFEISVESLKRVALSLNITFEGEGKEHLHEFSECLVKAKIVFEAYINNVVDGPKPRLSMQGAPLDILFGELHGMPEFKKKIFFFLIDEYENFENYQQRVVNTLVKHSGQLYTFKIGVRELGIKERATLNPDEQLISPADYSKINISEKLDEGSFKSFALAVCNDRIQRIQSASEIIRDVIALLPGMTEDEEASRLGIDRIVLDIKRDFQAHLDPVRAASVLTLSPLRIYFLHFWRESHDITLEQTVDEYLDTPKKWEERFQNYKHALLFTIKKKKSGIRKYYAGWDVFIRLAGSNIRYLLELVEQSLVLTDDQNLAKPVDFETQTQAAQNIGKKNLGELEGLAVSGGQLKKLLLSLGRIFQVMAANAAGHAPEVNQFHLSDQSLTPEVEELLNSGVMHLALLRYPGSKLMDDADTREHDYMIHPIFSAFFVFSYRRKRKMMLSGENLIGLVKSPRKTLREVLGKTDRNLEDEEPLPEQMRLFEGYYYGDNA